MVALSVRGSVSRCASWYTSLIPSVVVLQKTVTEIAWCFVRVMEIVLYLVRATAFQWTMDFGVGTDKGFGEVKGSCVGVDLGEEADCGGLSSVLGYIFRQQTTRS